MMTDPVGADVTDFDLLRDIDNHWADAVALVDSNFPEKKDQSIRSGQPGDLESTIPSEPATGGISRFFV
jgi:hypothetical protein